MNCPVCGAEVFTGNIYGGLGIESGVATHICQVFAESKGKALEEYVRRCDEAFSVSDRRMCNGCKFEERDKVMYPCGCCDRSGMNDYYEHAKVVE